MAVVVSRVRASRFITVPLVLALVCASSAAIAGGGAESRVLALRSGAVFEQRAMGGDLVVWEDDAGRETRIAVDGAIATTTLDTRAWPGGMQPSQRWSVRDGRRIFTAWGDGGTYPLYGFDGRAAISLGVEINRWGSGFAETHDGVLVVEARARGDGSVGFEPWRTDGTPDGTWLLADVAPGAGSSRPERIGRSGKDLFFVAQVFGTAGAAPNNLTLFRTDGTSASVVADVSPQGAHALASTRVVPGGVVFVTTSSSEGTTALWWLTSSGLTQRSISHGSGVVGATARGLVVRADPTIRRFDDDVVLATVAGAASLGEHDGRLVFCGLKMGTERLYVTDGSPEGTMELGPVAESEPVSFRTIGSTPTGIVFGVHVLAPSRNSSVRREIWSTDGTPARTHRLAVVAASAALGPGRLLAGGLLAFGVGRDLWISDGTVDGTHLAARGVSTSSPATFEVANDLVYYLRSVPSGTELWRWDPDASAPAPPDAPDAAADGGAASRAELVGEPTSGAELVGEQSRSAPESASAPSPSYGGCGIAAHGVAAGSLGAPLLALGLLLLAVARTKPSDDASTESEW